MTSLLAAVIASALAIWQAPASPKPDFNGSWILDRGPSAYGPQGEPLEPVKLNIQQSSEQIVIETVRDGKASPRKFPIDLTARRDLSASPSVSPQAYWDGARLVTEGAITINGQTVSTRE